MRDCNRIRIEPLNPDPRKMSDSLKPTLAKDGYEVRNRAKRPDSYGYPMGSGSMSRPELRPLAERDWPETRSDPFNDY